MGRKWGRECREKNMSKGEMELEIGLLPTITATKRASETPTP